MKYQIPNALPMKNFGLILGVAVLLPLAGCKWIEEHMSKDPNPPKPKGQVQTAQADDFVTYLNNHAALLRSIVAEVRVTATDRSGALPTPPITLTGELCANQPRNFCLAARGGGFIDTKVILGSNDQQFWVYAKVPTADPVYVFASHTDYEQGRAKLFGGIPFEPDWVMQTLGMIVLPPADTQSDLAPGTPTKRYSLKTDEAKRTSTLGWSAVTPSGAQVVKEIVFETDRATGTRPQVKKHVIRDANTNKVICYAEIKAAKTVPSGPDARPTSPSVQYPTKVVLRWEEPAAQRFEMDLEVLNAKINQPLPADEARRRFTRPNIPGANPINLAGGEIPFK